MMPEMPETSPPKPRSSMDVSEWPVVRKVALVLAVPFLLAVLLGALRVQAELSDASAATSAASQVTVLGPSVEYLSAAEDASIVFRATNNQQQRKSALKAVNAAAADLESAWSEAALSDEQRQQVRALLDTTQGLRDGSAYSVLSTAVDQLDRLESEVTLGIAGMTDGGARTENLINLVGQLNKGRLAVTRGQLLVAQGPSVIPKNDLYGLFGAESAVIDSLELLLPDDASVATLRQYNSSNIGLLGIGTSEIKGQQPLALYDDLATSLLDQIEDSLSAEAAASNRIALLTALLTGLALLIAIGLALAVSRALVRPIRVVRDGALAVAHESLPETVRRIRAGQEPGRIEPIPVTTHEELGQLARAVDDLHSTAVRLAQDESELRSRVGEMFTTLSRRNTSLVNQQLHLIERLERDEEDPQRLESLFRLDHLASRMRRTAESLVILAGTPSQHSEQDALSVEEALHAATAGVRDYPRVELAGAPSHRINGAAAPDVVHLFTELIDNALSFSPPTAPVRVTTSTPAGMVLVEIVDAGLGIDSTTLLDLNATLRTGAEITADAARRMGLFVVARLARRHGLTVTLERNAEGGTTARVFLPKPLLSQPEAPDSAPDVAIEVEDDLVEDQATADVSWFADAQFRGPAEVPAVSELDVVDPVIGETEDDELAAEDTHLEEHDLEEPAAEDTDHEELDHEEPTAEELDHEEPTAEELDLEEPVLNDEPPAAVTPEAHGPAAAVIPVPTRPQLVPGQQPLVPSAFTKDQASSALDSLAAVINANIRLPQRDPGTAPQPSPLTSLLRQRMEAAQPPPTGPVNETDANEPDGVECDAVVQPPAVLDAEVEIPETRAADTLAVVLEQPELPEFDQPELDQPELEPELEPALEQPAPLAPVARPVSALDGDAPAYDSGEETDEETPMFRMLRSNWFDSVDDADAGWRAADLANDAAPPQLTQSGLPVRDPGNRLVPGGVAQEAPRIRRDPEALRARLAAHAAGVARGRNTAPKLDPHPPPTKTAEDVTG